MANRCAGLTRKGSRCSITSTSRLADESGRLVAEPLQRGGAYCRLHSRPFVTQSVGCFDVPALLFYLDLESTGVDVASDQIVELACCHAPSDPRASGAAFSTTVRASAEDTAFHVHGIEAHEIAAATPFSVAWTRFLEFIDHLQRVALHARHVHEEVLPALELRWLNNIGLVPLVTHVAQLHSLMQSTPGRMESAPGRVQSSISEEVSEPSHRRGSANRYSWGFERKPQGDLPLAYQGKIAGWRGCLILSKKASQECH